MDKITLENIPIELINDSISKCNQGLYFDSIKNLIKRVLPDFFYQKLDEKNNILNEILPIVKWEEIDPLKSKFSVILFCKQKKGAGNFFYDLISRWLLPNKNLPIEVFFMSDFSFKDVGGNFTVAEMVFKIPNENEKMEMMKNKRTLETEIRLGVTSDFHANRIMQFKGLSFDKKTTMIQEKIASLMHTRSKDFGQSIFTHMQQFLVSCSDTFKTQRDYHHISRIISVLFLMKKVLKFKIKDFPEKRHINLKFLKTRIYSEKGEKDVLGIIAGLNFVNKHEVFDKQHLLKAISVLLPDAKEIENSFFVDKYTDGQLQTIYLEVKKNDQGNFTFDEIQKLKRDLPSEIKSHVERLTNRIFMPRNEEEVVRNILTLSRQLRFVNDIPQVIINFDEQTLNNLSFTIILLRILKNGMKSVQEIFKEISMPIKFIPDRVKRVGILRRKYLKEANVFKVQISSKKYIRKDNSVNLSFARMDVVRALQNIFGDIRDYNGGLICKQNEIFNILKSSLHQMPGYNELLLEKFFYAIRPIEMSVIIPPVSLKSLFMMLTNAIKREESRIKKHHDYLFKNEPKSVFAIIPVYDLLAKKKIKEAISKYYLLSSDFISLDLQFNEIYYLGYIFNSDDEIRQKNFIKVVQQILDFQIKSS